MAQGIGRSAAVSTLAGLADRLRQLPGLIEKMTQECGEEALRLTLETFATATDPWGESWAPRKGGQSTHLAKTGRLRSGWKVVLGGAPGSFSLRNRVPYARYYQYAVTMARPMIPSWPSWMGTAPIPEKWAKRISAMAQRMVEEHLGGR